MIILGFMCNTGPLNRLAFNALTLIKVQKNALRMLNTILNLLTIKFINRKKLNLSS